MAVELFMGVLWAAFAVAFYAISRYYYARFKMRKLVGPPPLPIIGNLHQFGEDNPAFLRIMLKWSEDFRDAGYFVMFVGWTPYVMIFNPRDMETMLCDSRFDTRSFHYDFFRSWLNDGLLLSKGEKWLTRRKLLTPSFHFAMLKKFNVVFNDHARTFTEKLCSWADGREVDLATPMSLCTLDVAFETILGTNARTQLGHQKSYVEAIDAIGNILTMRSKYPWYQYEEIFKRTPLGRKWAECVSIAHRKSRQGHDTTATATSFALYLLARHTDVQVKVQEELDRVFKNNRERPVTTDDIQQLDYLNCVIKECQRMLTTIPYIGRRMDVPVRACGTTLPKGTSVYLGLFFLHRDPAQFPDPLRFDPDRFLPENSKDRHKFSFLPFAAGNRNCIGQKYAVLEQKTIIATVLRKLSLTSSQSIDEMGLAAAMVLRASNGIKVKIHLREE